MHSTRTTLAILPPLALLVFAGYALGRGGAAPAPSSPASPSSQPASLSLPSFSKANTIITKPFSEHPELAATRVTLDFDNVDAATAMARLTAAAKVPLATTRAGRGPNPFETPVSLHLQDQPYLEALLQLQAQAGLSTTINAAGETSMSYAGYGPGLWSVAGPFAFAIQNITHRVTLDREGRATAVPGVAGRGVVDPVTITFIAYVEPRLRVLQYASAITLTEAVDNRDHSLLADIPTRAGQSGQGSSGPIRATLAYPPANAGRRIARLRGTAAYTVQLKSEAIALDKPFTETAEHKFDGMVASFGIATWNEERQILSLPVYYRRANYVGDWPTLVLALAGARPVMEQPTPRTTSVIGPTQQFDDNGVSIAYNIRFGATIGRPVQPPGVREFGRPEVTRITLEIPTKAAQVDVPVVFNDIPLP